MKSVGEVMAIGCTFRESLQKALRGLEIGMVGFDPVVDTKDSEWRSVLKRELASTEHTKTLVCGRCFSCGIFREGYIRVDQD